MTHSEACWTFVILLMSTFILLVRSNSIYGECDNSKHTFNCSGVGLTEIPPGDHIPSYMETLDLSNNHISNITFIGYPMEGNPLSLLNLSNNQIYQIKKDAFDRFTNLVTLDVSNNLIYGPDLEENMFNYLKKLKYLNMERNPIRHMKKDTFTFYELPSIKTLDLSHCEIGELEAGSLDLPPLEHLDLSWNKLTSFKEDSFRMLVNLKTLDMSHNRIRVLDEMPHMPELVSWTLDNNGMETVQIRDDIVNNADNLQKLYLRNNDIEHFDADSFPLDELDNLQVIDMRNNKLKCDCKMKWVLTDDYDLEEKNYTFTCEDPSSMRNKNLLTMKPDELKCGLAFSKIFLSVLVLVVGLSVIVFAIFCVVRRWRRRKRERRASRGDNGGEHDSDDRSPLKIYSIPEETM